MNAPKRRGLRKKTEHPQWWEREVQSDLRTQRPPLQPPRFMVVGDDAEGIAGAAVYSEIDGPGVVEVESMAVAMRHRGRGGAVADQLFQEIIARIDERAVLRRVSSVLVSGRIYGLNVASQRMALRAGMRHVDTFPNGVQQWLFSFATAPVDEGEEDSPQLF